MRAAALCDRHAKLFEEPEDPTNRSFFSEIISSISDVKLSNSGRYMISRDYLSVKVWDLHMETRPIETYPVSIIIISTMNNSRSKFAAVFIYNRKETPRHLHSALENVMSELIANCRLIFFCDITKFAKYVPFLNAMFKTWVF